MADTNDLAGQNEEWGHPGGLMGALLQQSLNNAHSVGQQLYENEKERADTLQSTLDAVRRGIEFLLDGEYMPTSAAIMRALYPSQANIDYFRHDGDL